MINAEDAAAKRYLHRATKAKEICSPQFALALVLYPSLMAFLFAARMGAFSLLIPTPTTTSSPPSSRGRLRGKFDLWDTGDDDSITGTAFAFAAMAVVHMFIVFHLLMRGVPGSWYLKKNVSWVAPVMLWFVTTAFYITYVSMARYRAHRGEWGAAAAFSAAIFLSTFAIHSSPPRITDLMEEEADPAAA